MYGQSHKIPVGESGVLSQGAPQHQAHGVRGLHNAASKLYVGSGASRGEP